MARGRKSRQRKSSNGAQVRKVRSNEAIKWAARELRSAYEAGNKNALWKMIVVCALSKSPIPEWAASILEGADGYVAWGRA